MTIHGTGHPAGDPSQYCGALALTTTNWHEARRLAVLFRVLTDPDARDMLIEAAEGIEATKLAASDPVLA